MLGSFASSSGGRPLRKPSTANHHDQLDKSLEKVDNVDTNPNLQVKQKGLLGRMRYHSDLLVELLPNPSDKTSTRLKRYRHECVIGMKASDYMIRVLQTNKGDPTRPKKIIRQKLKFSKLCLENWFELLHSMNPLDRFLTFCDDEDLNQKAEEEPVFYVPLEERKSRRKTVKIVQSTINKPTTKELLSPSHHRPLKMKSTQSVKQLLRKPSMMMNGSPDSMGLMMIKPQNTRTAKIKATRMGANLNVTMIMDPVDSSSEEAHSPTKINFGFNEWATQLKEKPEKVKQEVMIAQSAAHRLSEKFILEEILYSSLSLIFQHAKVLYLVDGKPELAYKLLVRARRKIKKICVESMFSSHHYLHIKINLLLSRIMMESKFFKEALMLTWENVSAYRTASRVLFNPELEHTRKVNSKFMMITKHFVLSLYQMSLCYLNLDELSNLAFSVQMMSQICVAHLSRTDELVAKVFQFIEVYKLSVEPILFAQRELGSVIQKMYEDISAPNLDHLIDHKFEAKKLDKPKDEEDPHTFQEAELAVSLGYEPELDQRLELKREIQESTKKYIKRLDTVVAKDLGTSLFSSKKMSLGSLNPPLEKVTSIDRPSEVFIESPLLGFEGPRTSAMSDVKHKMMHFTTAANSRPGSPPVNFTPVKTGAPTSKEYSSPRPAERRTESVLDALIDSQQKIHEQTERKVKPLAKIKILQNPNSNHMFTGRSPRTSKIYASSPRSSSPQSNLKLDTMMGEFYVKPSLENHPQSPKEWTSCMSDYSVLCQEDHLVRKETKFHKDQFNLRKEVAPSVTDLICEKKEREAPAYMESLTHKFFEIKAAKIRERTSRQVEKEKKDKLANIRKEANEKFQRAGSSRSPRSSVFGTKSSLMSYKRAQLQKDASESSDGSESSRGYTSEQKQVLKARVRVQKKLCQIMEAHPDTFKIGSILDCRRRLHMSPYAFVWHGSSHEYPKGQNHFKDTKDSILKNIGILEKDNSLQDLRIRKLTDRGIYETNKFGRSGSHSPPTVKKINVSSNLLSAFRNKASERIAQPKESKPETGNLSQFPKGFNDLYKSTKGLEFQAFQNKESKPFRELFVRLKQGAKLSDFIKKSNQEANEVSATSDSRNLLTELHGGTGIIEYPQCLPEELEFKGSSVLD